MSRRSLPRCLLCVPWLAPFLAGGALAAPSSPVRILVDSPAPGATVAERVHQARVEGSAIAEGERPADYDVAIVIDVSWSTLYPSGVDVDGDGVVGVNPAEELIPPGTYPPDVHSTDPQDTVLHAETHAALALLESLDPRRVRVALITFGGEVDPITGERRSLDQQDAWLEVPLTDDFDEIRIALTGVLARGSHGATNFAAGEREGRR